ncbi:membrane protein insertion efficiency factor YidD [Promicromonospora thailandica]|uniref:Hemolytic domain-containing protein n=1 Tax=Promicromonospora thailandica TaxID=765201 RepID=A0A9X2G2B9_9MICO|nr:membrane protein insertion efficiency factor YidD [Promicromonospora thailandica]MCP2265777.1 hemolytic domain-containing protein [Promicromonospora thailandica]BFF21800.1 membrane protein insertion efficiency factor YidD [Promicromonospora thailandica]
MSPAARAVDRAIATYQRRISPRKGWHCAHGVLYGDDGCSSAARTLLARHGLVRTALPMAARFLACYQAARMLALADVQGVCCCGPIPIPFGWRSPRR